MNELLLLAGSDIPFPEARITIHQPTLKEISYVGEQSFFTGCGFLDFSKDILTEKDKTRLVNIDDFDIFMSMLISKEPSIKPNVDSAFLVLSLIFPLHEAAIEVRENSFALVLQKEDEKCEINKSNFSKFKEILREMFGFSVGDQKDGYNPSGSMAEKIANKFKKRQQQLQEFTKELSGKRISILSRYSSILAVGLQKDLNDLMQYTVYQLYNEFQRFQLKVQWDAHIQARMAGAKDLGEIDNWMIDLKDQGKNKK